MKYLMVILATTLFCSGCSTVGQIEKFRVGMTKEEITTELGEPKYRSVNGSSETLIYDLQKCSKPVQALLAYPTIGIVFLFQDRYQFDFKDNQLASFGRNGSSSGDYGIAAMSTVLQGMGQGLSGSERRSISCTSTNYGYSTQTSCH